MLIVSTKCIFTVQDLAVLWSLPRGRNLFESIKYYVRSGKLIPLRRGLYALPNDVRQHSQLELAQKIVPLSYISLSTALTQQGLVFQFQQSIQSVAMTSINITVLGQKFEYHKIKEDIFFNATGLVKQDRWTLAGPERAICDTLYFFPKATFDNLLALNLNALRDVAKIYNNQSLENRIQQLIKKQETLHA